MKISKFIITSILIAVVVLFFYFLLNIEDYYMSHCEFVEYVKKSEFDGVITEKIDNIYNHNGHGLEIMTNNVVYILDLTSDLRTGDKKQSYLWHTAAKGDSIKKAKNEFLVVLKKESKIYKHEIAFPTLACE